MRRLSYWLVFFSIFFANFIIQAETIIPINPVIVFAPKKPKQSLTSATKNVLTHEQIVMAGSNSLAQVLHELGGLQLQDSTGNGSQVAVSMRGFGANASSNMLLLINGIPITNPDIAPPDLNTIPLPEIAYIEIIAGSESVLYGDQAVGGIINIISGQPDKESLALACDIGSYRQHRCYINVRNYFKMLHYDVYLSNTHNDNYRDHNKYDQNLLQGNLRYSYATGRLRFDYQMANEQMQYPGSLTAAQVRQDRRQAKNDTDFFKDWSGFFHIQHRQNLNSDWRLQTDFARREMHGHGVLFSPFTQSRVTHFFKPAFTGIYREIIITTGFDFQDDRYHLRSLLGVTADKQQKWGLFGVLNIPLLPRTHVALGLRGAQQNNQLQSVSNHHNTNRALATTLGVSLAITREIMFYLRRAESFRFPKADENASTLPGVNGLKTQRGVAYETGIDLNRQHYTAKLGLYQLNLRDEITFDPTQTIQAPFGTNRNLPPTFRRGLTLSSSLDIHPQWTIGGQYNYVNARFQNGINAGNRIPLVAENILRANINFRFMPNWNFYSEAIFTGNQYAANDDGNVAGKLGGFTIYNFNLRYQFKNFVAAFRINNIFNKFYYLYTVFTPDIGSEAFYPAPGRNFLLTLTYTFF